VTYFILYTGIGIIYSLYLMEDIKNIIKLLRHEKNKFKINLVVFICISMLWPIMIIVEVIDFIVSLIQRGKNK